MSVKQKEQFLQALAGVNNSASAVFSKTEANVPPLSMIFLPNINESRKSSLAEIKVFSIMTHLPGVINHRLSSTSGTGYGLTDLV